MVVEEIFEDFFKKKRKKGECRIKKPRSKFRFSMRLVAYEFSSGFVTIHGRG